MDNLKLFLTDVQGPVSQWQACQRRDKNNSWCAAHHQGCDHVNMLKTWYIRVTFLFCFIFFIYIYLFTYLLTYIYLYIQTKTPVQLDGWHLNWYKQMAKRSLKAGIPSTTPYCILLRISRFCLVVEFELIRTNRLQWGSGVLSGLRDERLTEGKTGVWKSQGYWQ